MKRIAGISTAKDLKEKITITWLKNTIPVESLESIDFSKN